MAKTIRKKAYSDRDRLQDYRHVFASDAGKRVINDLIARHYVLGSTFSGEPTIMAHAEGQREVVLQILRFLQMTPADIPAVRLGMLEQFELEPGDDTDGQPP